MIRTVAKKTSLLAVAALFMTSMATVSCSKKDNGPVTLERTEYGAVGLALRLSNGADVSSVGYKVSGNGIVPITGSIPLADPTSTVSVQIKNLPVGTGYIAELNATSSDGKTTCGGTATFDIVAASTTSVTVRLQCRTTGAPSGSVVITGTFNNCPALSTLIAAPATVAAGGTINLSASGFDADGDTLTYAWTAPTGTFGTATAASTTYKAAGAQLVTITVSDGQCSDTASVPVTFGGSAPVIVCGNGLIEAGEQCDPPGATCSATCQTIVPPMPDAGVPDMIVSPPDMIVSPPDMIVTPVDPSARTAACLTCEEGGIGTGDCDAAIGCKNITNAADRALCEALDKCMRTTGCWNKDPLDCLCGTAVGTACASAAANGACKAQIQAATKTTDPVANGTLFYSMSVPAGNATQQSACDRDICPTECKFP